MWQRDDRVATLMWNNQTHMEVYLAVPCMGAILHTLNVRLFPDQLAYIINHAEDKVIVVDPSLVPLLARIKEQIPGVRTSSSTDHAGRPLRGRSTTRISSRPRSRASTGPTSTRTTRR